MTFIDLGNELFG